MDAKKRLRKIIKWGPWHYRFWREAIRRPYEIAFPTPAVAPDPEAEFPQITELRARFEEFRAEAVKVSTGRELPNNHEIMPAQKTFYDFDKIPWKMVPLRAYGFDYPENMQLMPLMADFLKRNPNVVSATISVFPPGKRLRPHRGPLKAVWRYHLGYLIEELDDGRTGAELIIDGKTHHLHEGDDLLWDDTYMHEARNPSSSPRIVLLLDIYRNNHPWWLGWLSRSALGWAQFMQWLIGVRKRAAIAR